MSDEPDLAQEALRLAAAQQPGISLERYQNHLRKIAQEVGERHMELCNAGAYDNAETRLAALKHILSDKHGYTGDREDYNNIQNASLIRTIDRGKGMPITLSILYIATGRAQGWDVDGINFPGHFVCRIEHDGQRVIFDPFENCKILQAADLRVLLKQVLGEQAELSIDYFKAATNRQILIRLQNNIKSRQIEMEDYEGALRTVEDMRRIDPQEYRLLLDAGVLYARAHKPDDAIAALEEYIKLAPDARDRRDAELLLRQIRETVS